MASKEELLESNTKEELVEKAKEAGLSGYSTLNKEELADQLANFESEGGSSEKPLADQMEPAHEGGRGVAQTESRDLGSRLTDSAERREELAEKSAEFQESHDEVADIEKQNKGAETKHDAEWEAANASHHSAASDAENPAVQEGLSPEGQDALEQVGEDSAYATESDLALDASGPLHFENPASRVMTGAVNEAHAKEQEKALKDKPDDWVGDVTESGFDKDGNVKTEHGAAARAANAGSEKDNLHKSDKRDLREVRPEDVIDFPPPVGEREFDRDAPETVKAPPSSMFSAHISPIAPSADPQNDARRGYQQKSVFYTDGLSGSADHNHERAYEYGELLQSNNPSVRKAGDESVSEAAWDAKSDKEKAHAKSVIERDDDPSQVSRNSDN
jgi:hypothetical protein